MAMGRRKDQGRTPEMWVATHTLPTSPGHPFYQALNRALDAEGFDDWKDELGRDRKRREEDLREQQDEVDPPGAQR